MDQKIVAALKAAEANAGKHDKTVELEGPFESAEQINRTLGLMLKKCADAGTLFCSTATIKQIYSSSGSLCSINYHDREGF